MVKLILPWFNYFNLNFNLMMRYLLLALFLFFGKTVAQLPLYETHYDNRISIGERQFAGEIADTLPAMQKGMMYRPEIRDDQAMLFVYPRPQRLTFWMKNTLIPLDMLFFDEQGILLEIKQNVPPCTKTPCPVYPSRHDSVKYVVELNGGASQRLAIRVGDRLTYHAP